MTGYVLRGGKQGIATPDQVTAALASLRRFTADLGALICGPRVFQLWSRR